MPSRATSSRFGSEIWGSRKNVEMPANRGYSNASTGVGNGSERFFRRLARVDSVLIISAYFLNRRCRRASVATLSKRCQRPRQLEAGIISGRQDSPDGRAWQHLYTEPHLEQPERPPGSYWWSEYRSKVYQSATIGRTNSPIERATIPDAQTAI